MPQATTCGPQLAPLISGFISVVSWRWTYWVAFIVAGVSLFFLLFLPETYGPIILKHRARKMRKETCNSNTYAPIELEKKGAKQMITVTLMRPLNMIFHEAIVLFTCLYLSLAYAIFCGYYGDPLTCPL
jgi:MFS family permease